MGTGTQGWLCHLWGGRSLAPLALHPLAVPAVPLVFCQQQGRVFLIEVLLSVTNLLSKSFLFPKLWGTDHIPADGGLCVHKWCLVWDLGLRLGFAVVLQTQPVVPPSLPTGGGKAGAAGGGVFG